MKSTYPENSMIGATTACVVRAVEATVGSGQRFEDKQVVDDTNQSDDLSVDPSVALLVESPDSANFLKRQKREVFYGDSWFAGVKTAEEVARLGHDFVGPVKTSHKCFPKKFFVETMRTWPGGSYLVLEGTGPKYKTPLIAIGYKYNNRKVLHFIATKEAGKTTPGAPYYAKFAHPSGKVAIRKVQRPAVISEFFEMSNKVDTHNHVRQSELKLEKYWKTRDCWFRIVSTLLGMIVVDAWKAYSHGVGARREFKHSILSFVDCLVWDIKHTDFEEEPKKRSVEISPLQNKNKKTKVSPSSDMHTIVKQETVGKRAKRLNCRICRVLTTFKCLQCQVPLCQDYTKDKKTGALRFCWSDHLQCVPVSAAKSLS